jgi:hypothetical protein
MADEPQEKQREIRPAWSADIMFIANMSKMKDAISESSVQVEIGNLNAIFSYRAWLRELYDSMRFWINDNNTLEKAFKNTDIVLDAYGFNLENMPPSEFKQIKKYLNFIKILLFNELSRLFSKTQTVWTEDEKMIKYAFGRT